MYHSFKHDDLNHLFKESVAETFPLSILISLFRFLHDTKPKSLELPGLVLIFIVTDIFRLSLRCSFVATNSTGTVTGFLCNELIAQWLLKLSTKPDSAHGFLTACWSLYTLIGISSYQALSVGLYFGLKCCAPYFFWSQCPFFFVFLALAVLINPSKTDLFSAIRFLSLLCRSPCQKHQICQDPP